MMVLKHYESKKKFILRFDTFHFAIKNNLNTQLVDMFIQQSIHHCCHIDITRKWKMYCFTKNDY